MALLAVDKARAMILEAAQQMPSEAVGLTEAFGRVTAQPLAALRTQPPFDASAMDGYAVRASDLVSGAALKVIGESVAGQAFDGTLGPAQAVRIFTGAPVPQGADSILLQEHTTRDGDHITPTTQDDRNRHIRKAGIDFTEGETLVAQGVRLTPQAVSLIAAMGHPTVAVARRPKVAILANGDELVLPGTPCGPDQIVASNQFAVTGITREAGGEAIPLGIAPDRMEALEAALQSAREQQADILVTLGGASVGDRDLIREALARQGMTQGFWKIAMRPGKPLVFGTIGTMLVLGLPGNPVASIICARLFLVPLIEKMLGLPDSGGDGTQSAVLGCDLQANDQRQDYLRATLAFDATQDQWIATPFPVQDSSMLRLMAEAGALVVRQPFAPAAKKGDACRILRL